MEQAIQHTVLDFFEVKDTDGLRALLAQVTTREQADANILAFLGHFPSIPVTPGQTQFPPGLYGYSDHAAYPEFFPIFNERPQMFWGRVLDPNSAVAKAYDPKLPTVYIERLLPLDAFAVVSGLDYVRDFLPRSTPAPSAPSTAQ